MKHKVCIKCNSNEIIPTEKVLGNRFEGIPFNYLSIEIFENPNTALKKQRKNFEVQAGVCTDCG